MKRINTLFLAALIFAALAFTLAATAEEAQPGPYDAGKLSVSPFAAYKITEFNKSTAKWGGGLALGYTVVDNLEAEVSALSYAYQNAPAINSIDEAAINFKGYLPLGKSGFAPYGLLGYTRDIALDRDLMNVGAGLAWRGEWFTAGGGAEYRTDFGNDLRRRNEVLIKVFAGLTF